MNQEKQIICVIPCNLPEGYPPLPENYPPQNFVQVNCERCDTPCWAGPNQVKMKLDFMDVAEIKCVVCLTNEMKAADIDMSNVRFVQVDKKLDAFSEN